MVPKQIEMQPNDLLRLICLIKDMFAKTSNLLDESKIYKTVIEEFRRMKNQFNISILLLTEDGSRLRVFGTSLPLCERFERKSNRRQSPEIYIFDYRKSSVFFEVVIQRKTVEAKFLDVIEEMLPGFLRSPSGKVREWENRTAILTPLMQDSKVLGVIVIDSKERTRYLATIARCVAQHISTTVKLAKVFAERAKIEEELSRERDFLYALMDNVPDRIYFKDAESRFIRVNRAVLERLGVKDPEEVAGKTDFDFYPYKYAEETFRDEQRIMRTGQSIIGKVEMVERDGKFQWTSATKVPIINKKGQTIGIVGISRDITRLKLVEEELRRSAERLTALHRHAINLSRAKTAEEVAELTFDAIERCLGFKVGAFAIVEGNLLRFLYSKGLDVKGANSLSLDGPGVTVRAARTKKTQIVSDTRKDKDYVWLAENAPQPLSEIAVPVEVDGEVVAVINLESEKTNAFNEKDQELLEILATHISSAFRRLKQVEKLEKLVEERTRELRNAERLAAIGETAAMVGHDLRNPLQVIVNAMYLVKNLIRSSSPVESDKIANLTEILKIIDEQVAYMNKIVSDLQDFARPIHVEFSEIILSKVVEEVMSAVNNNYLQNIKVSIEIPQDFPPIKADPLLLRRVLVNLVTNAVQAMPEGGCLTIKAFQTDEAIFISVKDTGVGISEENMQKLFKPLFTTKPKGTGLGLAVCKRIVEAHGGLILVESKVGQGSTFTIKLPKS